MALRLLVECGGTAALTYFLRCIPPPADISKLTALDEILDESVELIVGAVSPAALTQARAPTRFGGIGLPGAERAARGGCTGRVADFERCGHVR